MRAQGPLLWVIGLCYTSYMPELRRNLRTSYPEVQSARTRGPQSPSATPSGRGSSGEYAGGAIDYDVEKWGTPEEWDRAIDSIGAHNPILGQHMGLDRLERHAQRRVAQNRAMHMQDGHNEARR